MAIIQTITSISRKRVLAFIIITKKHWFAVSIGEVMYNLIEAFPSYWKSDKIESKEYPSNTLNSLAVKKLLMGGYQNFNRVPHYSADSDKLIEYE